MSLSAEDSEDDSSNRSKEKIKGKLMKKVVAVCSLKHKKNEASPASVADQTTAAEEQVQFQNEPQKKGLKMLKGKLKLSTERVISIGSREEIEEHKLIVERWLCKCLSTSLVIPSGKINQVFCPIGTLSSFFALVSASPRYERSALNKMFFLDVKQTEVLRERLYTEPKSVPTESYAFFRLILDDSKDGVVVSEYLKLVQKYLGPESLVSCKVTRVPRYVSLLTGSVLSVHRPTSGLATGVVTAGIRARWDGDVMGIRTASFALSYGNRQKHPFFVLQTRAQTTIVNDWEIWRFPLHGTTLPFAFFILRPFFTGSLFDTKRHITPQQMKQLFEDVENEEESLYTVLMPKFSVRWNDDLWVHWRKQGVPVNLGGERAFPPLEHIWHCATISINKQGLGLTNIEYETSPTPLTMHQKNRKENFKAKHESFSARFDTPFLFVAAHHGRGLPLLAGTYAGHPPPAWNQIAIRTPEFIKDKSDPKILKPPPVKIPRRKKKTLMKREKLRAKIKKNEEKTAKTIKPSPPLGSPAHRTAWQRLKGVFGFRRR